MLVDEWQDAPALWDRARRIIDQSTDRGLFIFTGSAVPGQQHPRHTGTGRFARLRMRPMSLFESGDSNGNVSLQALLQHEPIAPIPSEMTYNKAVRLICRGGWPVSLALPDSQAIEIPRQYLHAVASSDISRADGVRRSRVRVEALLHAVARNTAGQAKIATIQRDVEADDHGSAVSMSSVQRYLDALEQIFVIDNLPPWIYSLRSKSQVRVSPTWHFTDPSLAAAALEATPETLAADPETAGLLFESLCVRDLRTYADAIEFGRVSHYRDNTGLEADAIIQGADGTWGAVEVKLGASQVDAAAENLLRLKKKLTGEVKPPAFLMVLTATGGMAYTRDDGITVVPLDCLGP
jgi:predicted AAA+ superfamily ATPase